MILRTRFAQSALALSAMVFLAAGALANDHYVPSGGASTFATIQDALNSASVVDGDTIFVTSGGPYGPLTVGKSVTIDNISGGPITITGGGNGVTINNSASPTIDGFTISGNSANGIAIDSAGTVTVLNTTITGNNTGGNDSAIQITGATSPTIIIEDSSLDGNLRRAFTVDVFGAGGSLTATNTTFNSNGETGIFLGAPGGAAIVMDIILNDCEVNGNGTGGFGRGIQVFGGSVTTSGGTINDNNNQGLMSDGGFGNVTFDLTGTTISGNGEKGVALFAQGGYTFTNCDISNNTQQGIHRIFNGTPDPTTLVLDGTSVNGNQWEGVFIEVQRTDLTIVDSEFLGNADGADSQLRIIGGEVVNVDADRSYFDWNNSGANLVLVSPGTYNLRNCVINGGGGVVGNVLAENGGTFVVEHCTIASAPGASAAGLFSGGGADCNFTVRNTIFAGVTTAIVNHRATNSWSVDYSLFFPDSADIGGGEPGAVGGIGANSISGSDPLFATNTTGFGTGDFRLTAGSPALAAGTDLAFADDIDSAARPNPTGSDPDMGAYEAGPDTSLSDALIDFGANSVNVQADDTINIVNDGIQAVTVTGITITGTDAGVFGFTAPATPFPVNALDSLTIDVSFEASSAGSYTDAMLEVTTNDAVAPLLTASLAGEAFDGPAIDAAPTSLAFGSVVVGGSSDLQVDISNAGDQQLTVDSLAITGTDAGGYELITPPATPFNIAVGGPAVTVTVRFEPDSAGSYNDADLVITSSNATNSPVSVPLTGTGLDPQSISLDPPSLSFGQVEVTESGTLTFDIINTGDVTLNVTNLDIIGTDQGAYSLVSPPATSFPVNQGTPVTITVEFAPTSEALFNDASVEVTSDDPVNPVVTVDLSGEGIATTRTEDWMMLD